MLRFQKCLTVSQVGYMETPLVFQGTTVYPLLASALLDETEWKHPHTFYPAHFLDKEGKFFKPDAFLPFSAGSLVKPSHHPICWK